MNISLKSSDAHDVFTWTNTAGSEYDSYNIISFTLTYYYYCYSTVFKMDPGVTMMILITSGASWTLTFEEQMDAETLRFSVGKDCPYYNNGYTTAKLHIKGILGIEVEGPGGELYVKLKQGTVLPDCDFEENSCGWNDAVELNSTQFFRFARTKGSLHPNGDYAPPTDHVNNAEGMYMWASALLGKPGDHTEITSPKVANNSSNINLSITNPRLLSATLRLWRITVSASTSGLR